MARRGAPRRRPVTTEAEVIGSLVAALADNPTRGPVDGERAPAAAIEADIAPPAAAAERPPLGDSGEDVARLLALRLVELDSARRGGHHDPAR
ncbi:MAG: hypothetical protein KY443_00935 [Actinobacteria bacterium]|nr:hypothetical protein [Actinomycetota bacterium]